MKKGEMKMIEMTVKFAKEKVDYTDKKTNEKKQFDKLVMELPNGKKIEIKSNEWNYRTVDFISDLVDGKEKI